MRQFKFRAYDTHEKVMVDWLVLCQTAFNTGEKGLHLLYDVITNNSRFITMQRLDQPDKHGNAIFEGDIMKVRVSNQHYGIRRKTKDFPMVVAWNESQCGFQLQDPEGSDKGNYRIYSGDWHHHEVVGNIYENFELLRNEHPNTNPH